MTGVRRALDEAADRAFARGGVVYVVERLTAGVVASVVLFVAARRLSR